jgi:aspartyl/asparaginyl beta-hydroxylase (cupin superfamily)
MVFGGAGNPEVRTPEQLTARGLEALRAGRPAEAKQILGQVAQLAPANVMSWVYLAMASKASGDEQGEAAAIERALACDPMDLIALVMKSRLLDRMGSPAQAAKVHEAVTKVAPPDERLSPDLRAAVAHSRAKVAERSRSLEALLETRLGSGGDLPPRFRETIDILLGKQRRYQQEPVMLYYPGLAPTYFFDRVHFPWLDAVEAATDAIREEFLQVLQEDRGFSPYIDYPPGLPLNQWRELNGSSRWNAFHLFKNGELIEENASRCPRTMEALRAIDQPQSPNRSPNAMFSLLAPHTRIPPHTGVVNTRLVTHLPLIVPEGCGFRVGADVRPWRVGEGFAFDDTIEHEAWNDSNELRVVLIFDVWRPELSPAERALIVQLMNAMDEHDESPGAWDL